MSACGSSQQTPDRSIQASAVELPTADAPSPTADAPSRTADAPSPTSDAVEHCDRTALDASDRYLTPVTVAGAVDTDVAGLRRAAAHAITFEPGIDDADKWPGVDASANASLCYLDGNFEEVPGYDGPVERLVIGYRPDSWIVLDFGPTARIPIVAP